MTRTRFREAASEKDFAGIHRLNHRTFAEELGQYETDPSGVLVDRFHASNRYFVAAEDGSIAGMISLNSTPPFSIEGRLQSTSVLAAFRRPAEIRLLAVEPGARQGMLLGGLFWRVYECATALECTHLLISGISARREMYRDLGFEELGPAVQSGAASYIPMALEMGRPDVRAHAARYARWWSRRMAREPLLLLPGPVEVAPPVRAGFHRAPISHRGAEGVLAYNAIRLRLRSLSGGMHAALLSGSGTLGNDIVAACLRARFGARRGLVLANGEFGERLIRQAEAAGLDFRPLRSKWGATWHHAHIAHELAASPAWVWAVHLETSTGVLNDLDWLARQTKQSGAVLAADCVSSFGAVPLDHIPLAYASGVSGKALSAYAGLAFVMLDESALRETPFKAMPSCFNLCEAQRQQEPMFTLPSPQLLALRAALQVHYGDADAASRRFEHYAALAAFVRGELRVRGHAVLAPEHAAAPTVCTFPLPPGAAERCVRAGFQIAHESGYLRSRGWGQISTMGALSMDEVRPVFAALGDAVVPDQPSGTQPERSSGGIRSGESRRADIVSSAKIAVGR